MLYHINAKAIYISRQLNTLITRDCYTFFVAYVLGHGFTDFWCHDVILKKEEKEDCCKPLICSEDFASLVENKSNSLGPETENLVHDSFPFLSNSYTAGRLSINISPASCS